MSGKELFLTTIKFIPRSILTEFTNNIMPVTRSMLGFFALLPEVQAIYKKMWNCEKLITSFDGCCYIPKDLTKKDNCWTHTDQAPATKGANCYQGFLALTSNKERTLVVYEGSHKLHERYFADCGNTSTTKLV